MKEASGEFSMTLVVIVGAIIIVTLLSGTLGPLASNYIEQKWTEIKNSETLS